MQSLRGFRLYDSITVGRRCITQFLSAKNEIVQYLLVVCDVKPSRLSSDSKTAYDLVVVESDNCSEMCWMLQQHMKKRAFSDHSALLRADANSFISKAELIEWDLKATKINVENRTGCDRSNNRCKNSSVESQQTRETSCCSITSLMHYGMLLFNERNPRSSNVKAALHLALIIGSDPVRWWGYNGNVREPNAILAEAAIDPEEFALFARCCSSGVR
ncbi:hypothetical protein GQ600_22183 [Phytophthora cactorum]|nr:hypothetical protein GQ600_22183 [Phytophthora cactorum]